MRHLSAILCFILLALVANAAEPPGYTEDHALGGGITELGRSLSDIRAALKPWQQPRPEALTEARRLVPLLDVSSFEERDQAMAALYNLLRESEPALRSLINPHGDHPPETRARLRWLSRADLNDPVMPLRGLLEWIRVQQLSTLLPELAAIRPENFDPALEHQFVDVVRQLADAAENEHRVTLLAWRNHQRPLLRRAAAHALRELEDLTPLLDDPDEATALHAAIRHAQAGKAGKAGTATAIDTLHWLRNSFNPSIAARAAWAAESASHFGDGAGFDLPSSIVSAADPVRDGRGLVIAGGNRPEVHRLAPDGQKMAEWAFDLDFIGDVIPMRDGHFLLATRDRRGTYALLKINDKGKIVWREKQPDYACPNLLSNGHIIVADDNQVRELDHDGKVIWRYEVRAGRGRMAWRTITGTTLIALTGSLIEVNEEKDIVWQYDFPNDYVVSCQGLPDGNRLLVLKLSNRVIEITPEKKIVWEWTAPGDVALWDSFRLPNGNLLAKTNGGALEVSYGKRLLWQMEFGDAGHVRRL